MNNKELYNYEILNKVIDKDYPWFNPKNNILYIPNIKYKYYIECAANTKDQGRIYYILLSNGKFNINCRKCFIDGYNRLKLNIRGELLNKIKREINSIENINIAYEESTEYYDVFRIDI